MPPTPKDEDAPPPKPPKASSDREAKLAAALRANLRRRKAPRSPSEAG